MIHATLSRCLRVLTHGEGLYDRTRKQAVRLYEEFSVINKSKLRSKEASKIIKEKVNKIQQVELFFKEGSWLHEEVEEEEDVVIRGYESEPETSKE